MKQLNVLFLFAITTSNSLFGQFSIQTKTPVSQTKPVNNKISTNTTYVASRFQSQPGLFSENTPIIVAPVSNNGNNVSLSFNTVGGALGDAPDARYSMFDCNKDGKDELLVINPNTIANDFRKLARNSSSNIAQAGAYFFPKDININDDVFFGEFSPDNGSTILVNDKRSNQFWHYQHNTTNYNNFDRPYPMISNWVVTGKYLTGDFNGDGKTDLLAWDLAKNEFQVALHKKNAAATNGPASLEPAGIWLKGWAQTADMNIVTGDFNGDKKDDIALVHQPSGEWWVALSNGSSFQSSSGYKSGVWLKPWAIGTHHKIFATDVNNDGKCDLVEYDYHEKSFHAVLSNGQYFDYFFKKEFIGNTISMPEQITFGKFEGNCLIGVTHLLPADNQFAYSRRAMSFYLTNYKRL